MAFFFAKRTSAAPSGGHRHLRQLAACLGSFGVKSYLLFADELFPHKPPPADWTFGIDVPVAPFGFSEACRHLTKDDVVVMPENDADIYLSKTRQWTCRKAIINQNGFYGVRACPWGGYRHWGVDFAIVTSPYIAALAEVLGGLQSTQILHLPYWIERVSVRQPHQGETSQRPISICYMPRKLPRHVEAITTAVSESTPDQNWISIENASDAEVSSILSQSDIFLSTQDLEGFGLPAAEAMACGCIVAGYAGTSRFSHPYATEENGFWARDRCIGEGIQKLEEAIRVTRERGTRYREVLAAGLATSERYSGDAFRKAASHLARAATEGRYEFEPVPKIELGKGAWWEIIKLQRARIKRSMVLKFLHR